MNNLKKLRLENKKTQKEVADILKISRAAYGHYESGARFPNLDMLITLSHYFNVSVDYIIGNDVQQLPLPSEERIIIAIWESLNIENRKALLKYADFLQEQQIQPQNFEDSALR